MSQDFPARLGVVIHPPKVVAVRHRREGPIKREDLEAVPREVELPDDLGPEQRDHVGTDGEFEPWENFLSDRRSAEHVTALQDQDLLSRASQVGRVDQAVVTAADDNDVVP